MTGLMLLAYGANLLDDYELDSVDARFQIRGAEEPPDDVVMVEIDDESFNRFDQAGQQAQWPWPRSRHGHLIDRLVEAGAKVIAFDVQFTEPSPPGLEEEDNALINAVDHANNVVLATTVVDEEGHTNVFGGEEVLKEIGALPGNAVFPNDPGAVIRKVPYKVSGLRSFAVVAAELGLGRRIDPPEGTNDAWIDFRGPPGTIQGASYWSVLQGKVPDSFFRGKIVVVGPAAPTFQDLHPTSTTRNELMTGVEVEASAIWTALHRFPLNSGSPVLTVVLIVLLGFLPAVASLRLSLRWTLALGLVLAAGFALATQLAFNRGVILTFIYPFAALALSTVGSLGAHYSVAAFERERTRDLFSRFVPETVVDQVLARTGSGTRLGGATANGTVMFTDLRGFTTFSEQLAADEVMEVVNQCFAEMSEPILGQEGTLVSFLGDGFMAVFGAPIEQDDHADRALAAAREIISDRLPRFNEWMTSKGYGSGFRMGIGVNSGPFVAGNVGSERRLEYTLIGDLVNATSRIEGLTKGTRHMLLFSDATREQLRRPPEDVVFVDEFEIRGRQGTIRLWSLESVSDPAQPDQLPEAAQYA
jgi:adenylate cyclase